MLELVVLKELTRKGIDYDSEFVAYIVTKIAELILAESEKKEKTTTECTMLLATDDSYFCIILTIVKDQLKLNHYELCGFNLVINKLTSDEFLDLMNLNEKDPDSTKVKVIS